MNDRFEVTFIRYVIMSKKNFNFLASLDQRTMVDGLDIPDILDRVAILGFFRSDDR